MSKVLKWILYVALGLVGLALIAGIFIVIFGGLGHGYYMMSPGFRMMEPFRFGYYNPIRGIFGGLLGLGILLLIIVGIVALVNVIIRGTRPAQMTQTNQPAQTTQPAPVAEIATPTRNCSNCGKPAQEDWKTCPYCGNPLT
jgi:hypothetical protein